MPVEQSASACPLSARSAKRLPVSSNAALPLATSLPALLLRRRNLQVEETDLLPDELHIDHKADGKNYKPDPQNLSDQQKPKQHSMFRSGGDFPERFSKSAEQAVSWQKKKRGQEHRTKELIEEDHRIRFLWSRGSGSRGTYGPGI